MKNSSIALKVIRNLGAVTICTLFTGCVITPPVVKSFSLNDNNKQIKADFKYGKENYVGGRRCVGEAKVENYGSKDYRSISIELTFYTKDNELIAKDSYYLTSGLSGYSKVNMPPLYDRSLTTPDGLQVFTGCPDNLDRVKSKFNAF